MGYTYQRNEAGLFVCPHCQKTTARQNTMHYHLKTHETTPPFSCNVCKKGFLQAQTLATHMIAKHSKGVSMFQCPACQVKSAQKGNCLRHFMKVHCPEVINKYTDATGKFTCDVCKMECGCKPGLIYHLATAGCATIPDEQRAAQLAALKSQVSSQTSA